MDSNLIYLTQTDTTVGFLSKDSVKLAKTKQRIEGKQFLEVVNSFKILKTKVNIPKKDRKFIRNSKQTTFIYPNNLAIRVIKNNIHNNFLDKFNYCYSSSANKSGENFNIDFSIKNCDIIIFNKSDFKETSSSKIYKLNKKRRVKIR